MELIIVSICMFGSICVICLTIYKCFKIDRKYPSPQVRTINKIKDDIKNNRVFHPYSYTKIETIPKGENNDN